MIRNYDHLDNVNNTINFKRIILFIYTRLYGKVFILYLEKCPFISMMASTNIILSDSRVRRKKTLIRKAH